MRAVKTGLSVAIVFILYRFLYPGNWSQGAMLASVAAIVCMQDSVGKTIKTGINRLIGTSIGALFACLLSLLLPNGTNFFLWVTVNTAALILLIYIFNLLHKPESMTIGCMVFIMIILGISGNAVEYSALRLFDTVVAIIITALINKFVFPTKPVGLP